jgi:hypothetical protein
MAWYSAGSVSVTNGSNAVTGTGTDFIANARVGDGFVGPDGRIYQVTNVASATALSISPNYAGTTAGAQAYKIIPIQGYNAESARLMREIIVNWGTQLSNQQPWTYAPTAAAARDELGLGSIATQSADAVDINGGTIDGTPIGSTASSTINATRIGVGVASDPAYSIKANSPILINAPSGQSSVILQQAGVTNGRLYAGGGPGTDVLVESARNVQLSAASSVIINAGSPLVNVAAFAANGNAGFGILTPDTSAKLQSSNGINLGNINSASPNVLDFFLRGNGATPNAQGTTTAGAPTSYGVQRSKFTRIGDRVFGTITLAWTGHTGTGGLTIGPLPYTASASNGDCSVSIYANGLIVGAGQILQPYITDGGTRITVARLNQSTGAESAQPIQANVAYMMLTFNYSAV